jgi:FtsZ-interacting cell division protein ZipA
MNVDPGKPYADALKAIAIAVALMLITGALFMGGWALGRHQMDKKLDAAKTALMNASTSLEAAADALTVVNTEAQRRIAQAKTDKEAADKAAIAAQAAQHAAEAKLAMLQQHEQQARKRPGCAALLDTDLTKVCGL